MIPSGRSSGNARIPSPQNTTVETLVAYYITSAAAPPLRGGGGGLVGLTTVALAVSCKTAKVQTHFRQIWIVSNELNL